MNRYSVLVLSIAAGVCAASECVAQVRRVGRKPEVVKKYGYALNLPRDWKAALLRGDQKPIVGKFAPDQAEIDKRGDFGAQGAEILVLRIPILAASTGKKTDKEKAEDEAERVRRELGIDKSADESLSVEEYIDTRYNAKGRYQPEPFRCRGKGKLKGLKMEFTSGSSYLVVGSFTAMGFHWGVIYRCPEDSWNDWHKCFLSSLKTFGVFEGEESKSDVIREATAERGVLTKEEQKEQIAKSIEGQSGWWAHSSENYVFLSNSDNKRLIRTLAGDVENLRKKVYEKLFPPTEKITAIGTVRVFSDQGEYHAYGGPSGSAGYWSSAREELVLFDGFSNVSAKTSIEHTKSVMYHEAFHQYIHYAVGDLAPHSWFNEGHGDYFAGHKVTRSSIRPKVFDWRTGYLRQHLNTGRSLIPIRSLVRLPQSEYYSNAGLKYAEGWAFIYFLRRVTRNKRWAAIPDRYFAHLKENLAAFKKEKEDETDGDSGGIPGIPGVRRSFFADRKKVDEILEQAIEHGFEGIDYDKLDEAFQKWVESIV